MAKPSQPARERRIKRRSRRAVGCLLGVALTGLSGPGAAESPFSILEVPSGGRTVAADLIDLDGDKRGDLFTVVFSGVPPRDRREIRVHFQRADGTLSPAADWSGSLPVGSAAYDLVEQPGAATEVVLLQRDRLTLLGWSGRIHTERGLPLPAPPLPFAADERGLDRLRLARDELGTPFRFLVPGLGECFVLDAKGNVLGRLEVGTRANYFIPPRPGPLISESDVEAYLDYPRLSVGDVDGDGLPDLVASGRHALRVFLQREDGRFGSTADRVIPLELMRESDHIRSSGSVRSAVADVDGDDRADLVVARSSGGIFKVKSETRLYLNRGDGWDLTEPDQRFSNEGAAATIQLIDLDADGRADLLDARIPVSVVELVELLVTRSLDVEARVHRAGDGGRFEADPWFKRSYSIGLNFDTFRPSGFIPSVERDLNGDGYRDLLSSADGKAIEVFLGGVERRLRTRVARQRLPTSGRLRFGHFDRDGLPDFVLYDPRAPRTPVRVGVNRGVLPDTRAIPMIEGR